MTIEQKIGYFFFDKAILGRALTRRSYATEQLKNTQYSGDQDAYQVLGNALIKTVLTELLIRANYTDSQDILHQRMSLESEGNLAQIAFHLEIDQAIKFSAAERIAGMDEHTTVLAGTLEALIGGIYFDGGFRAAREAVVQLFRYAFPDI